MSNFTDDSELDLIEVLNYVFSHIKTVILVCTLIAVSLSTIRTLFDQPMYQAETPISVNFKKNNPLDVGAALNSWSYDREERRKIFITKSFFNSQSYRNNLILEIIGRTNLLKKHKNSGEYLQTIRKHFFRQDFKDPKEALSWVADQISISVNDNNATLLIQGNSHSPKLAMAMSNVGAMILVEYNHHHLIKELGSVEEFVNDQIVIVQDKLSSFEQELANLQKSSKLFSVEDFQSKMVHTDINQLNAIDTTQAEVMAGEIFIKNIEQSLAEMKGNLKTGGVSSYLLMKQVQRKMDLLLYRNALDKGKRSPSNSINPEIRDVAEEFTKSATPISFMSPWEYLEELEKRLFEASTELKQKKAKLQSMLKTKQTREREFEDHPYLIKEVSQLRRDIKLTSQLYGELKSKLQEVRIQKAGSSNDLLILYEALTPARPSGMRLSSRLVVLFLASFIAAILILGIRYVLIPTIRGASDMARLGVLNIGEIPYWKGVSPKNSSKALLMEEDPLSIEANALRHVRFSLCQQLGLNKSNQEAKLAKIIAICSANSSEGKSFIASNLSYSFAKAQFKTAIIDLDVFKPSIGKHLTDEDTIQVKSKQLFSDPDVFLETQVINEQLDVIKVSCSYETLSLTDIMDSAQFYEYLMSLKLEYDVLFVDTAPLRNSLEGLVASKTSDAVIFIADQRSSLRHDVIKSVGYFKNNYSGPLFSVINFCYDEISKNYRIMSRKKPEESNAA